MLFSVSAVLMVLLALAIWGWVSPRSPGARRALLAVTIFYAIAGILEVPAVIARVIARHYGRFDATRTQGEGTAIVVLGAGDETVWGWDTQLPLLNASSAARVLEARRVFGAIDADLVVASGGEADRLTHQTPSAIVMRDELVRLGVPAARIAVESRSINTQQQAGFVTPILRAHNTRQLILVTSDLHMPRAMGAFRAYGWAPVAAAAPSLSRPLEWYKRWLPGAGLGLSSELAHEASGIAYYLVRGWWRP